MPDTLIAYLKKYSNTSFLEYPMNDVDSLALCQLSYLKFDGLVPDIWANQSSVTLRSIREQKAYESLFADSRYERDNKALFHAMAEGKRFGNMKLNCFIDIIEKEWETQFSAITFLLENRITYIAYRGTDENIIGWKEDFNMAYLNPVPGQALSVKYLNMVASKIRTSLYIGGHSKGGNLAVYAAMNCLPEIQGRILQVYSMDGPGFRKEIMDSVAYRRIADRIIKILPQSSMVGMLFENDEHYQVVESKTFGLAQHNPYTWKIKNGDFIRVNGLYQGRKFMDLTFNEWVLSLDEVQLRTFVDTLYTVISASHAEDLISFTAQWKQSMIGMIAALKEIDEETKQMLRQIISSLFELTRVNMKKEISMITKKPIRRNKEDSRRRD
ncbi:DUF2974 domain-containing protein [Lachnospiraceae bacterium OttesenSCG-928-D06]|nr:DUF2974 domain-containing protein [Lachnospiraceae bacterium OttesenSCG-928-D06]